MSWRNRMDKAAVKLALLAALAAGGCATRDDLFVLIPDQEGKTGTLVVSHAKGETVLNAPYAAARMKTESRAEAAAVTPKQAQEVFGKAIATQPARPVSFILYFIEGEDTLTAESEPVVDKIFAEIARRPVPEVVVIGHTDTVGASQYNDSLSLFRAQKVQNELIRRGIPADRIYAAGRGEREPLVPTEDEVAEPRNRRAEISVR